MAEGRTQEDMSKYLRCMLRGFYFYSFFIAVTPEEEQALLQAGEAAEEGMLTVLVLSIHL